MGRFISSDALVSTGQGLLGNNMYAYCNNNPVNNHDPDGEIPLLLQIGIGIGIVNNVINAVYYEFSDGQSDITSSSYQNKKPSRWEKIDYVKQETGDAHFFFNAWRYYSEYSLHEYLWYISQGAYQKDTPIFSEVAEHSSVADIYPHAWDQVWGVNVFTVLLGILGM